MATNDGAPTVASTRSIPVVLQGDRPATLAFNESLFWLTKSTGTRQGSEQAADPKEAFVCVPIELILNSSFVEDSDGGSMYVRLLAPPSAQSSPLLPFTKVKSAASAVAELAETARSSRSSTSSSASSSTSQRQRAEEFIEQVEGPCKKLRLLKIEARTKSGEKAQQWSDALLSAAYPDSKPFRRLKVIINPVGGPGKAKALYQEKVRPLLEAAGCKIDTQVTTHRYHGQEIAKALPTEAYDAIVLVSGDGMLHEVLNGFAERQDARKALQLPMCPIPAGSGNALSLNLFGVELGFNLALASLNAIKGVPMPLDICAVTQPKTASRPDHRGKQPVRRASNQPLQGGLGTVDDSPMLLPDAVDADPSQISAAPTLPYDQYYSFLSQAIGLMADLDLGTEHMRALGDTRFIVGYVSGLINNAECPIDIDVMLGSKGSKSKEDMRASVVKNNQTWGAAAAETEDRGIINGSIDGGSDTSGMPSLQHGVVTETLMPDSDSAPPLMSSIDPSWPQTILTDQPSSDPPKSSWARLCAPVSSLYGGKIPYVSRDLMQFPYALPGDGTLDLALLLHGAGRAGKVRVMNGAERGEPIYDKAVAYLKVEAYRVTPRLPAGDPRLKKGGLLSIDGESRPYAPFQVEVCSVKAHTLSLFGRFNVPLVQPPVTPVTEL